MPPTTFDPSERLRALATVLNETGLSAKVDGDHGSPPYIQVINPMVPDYRDRITLRQNDDDGRAWWFFHSWRAPIARFNDLDAAVADVVKTMEPRQGVRDAAS
jgi:hypothetical protein